MNLLMVVAVAGAIGLGEFFEAATVAFFFSLSLYLESWSVGRARNAVSALLDLAPPTARVIRSDGSETDVPAAEVAVNDRFIVRGGDRIPLDCEVAVWSKLDYVSGVVPFHNYFSSHRSCARRIVSCSSAS
ncbi:hypothetical protein LCGC14_2358130, partial [marine sediment metagenome]